MDAIARIELYNNLFYVFAGIGAVSLILSIVFFIRFDIPGIFAIMTGRSRKRTIRQIDDRNSQTGKLRREYPIPQDSKTAKQSRTGRVKKPAAEKPKQTPAPSRQEQRQAAAAERPDTEILRQETPETMPLRRETGNTEELAKTTLLTPRPEFEFRITEQTIRINTEEWI